MAGQDPRFGGGALRARRTWRARRSFAGRERGQATVEAAVLIPALFTALLLLLQPGILLYDRMVMQGAAGNLHLETTVSLPAQPAWVDGAEAGRDPAGWIGAWLR